MLLYFHSRSIAVDEYANPGYPRRTRDWWWKCRDSHNIGELRNRNSQELRNRDNMGELRNRNSQEFRNRDNMGGLRKSQEFRNIGVMAKLRAASDSEAVLPLSQFHQIILFSTLLTISDLCK